jgi:hypothetical protein
MIAGMNSMGPETSRRAASGPPAQTPDRPIGAVLNPPPTKTMVNRLMILGPWLVTALLFGTTVAFAVAATIDAGFGMDPSTAGFLLLICLWALVQSTVGTAIAWRRPDNRIGRLMQVTAPLIVSVFIGYLGGAIRYLTHGPTDPVGGLAAWWGNTMIYPVLLLAFPALALLFPDGRLPSRRFRAPLTLVVGVLVLVVAAEALARGQVNEGLPDNPFGLFAVPMDLLELLVVLGGVALVGGMALGIAAVVVRWRRGTALERAQLKWLLAPLSLGVASFGFAFASSDTELVDLVSFLSALLLPVAIGIAVLRYRLYEIDRLISRTLSWALVTGSLLAVYAIALVAFQAMLAGFTQGQTLAVAASTLLAFALFQPARRRIHRAVDRRFDRARYDAQRTTERFAEQLRHEVDLVAVRAGLTAVASEVVRPIGATVWLRSGAEREGARR